MTPNQRPLPLLPLALATRTRPCTRTRTRHSHSHSHSHSCLNSTSTSRLFVRDLRWARTHAAALPCARLSFHLAAGEVLGIAGRWAARQSELAEVLNRPPPRSRVLDLDGNDGCAREAWARDQARREPAASCTSRRIATARAVPAADYRGESLPGLAGPRALDAGRLIASPGRRRKAEELIAASASTLRGRWRAPPTCSGGKPAEARRRPRASRAVRRAPVVVAVQPTRGSTSVPRGSAGRARSAAAGGPPAVVLISLDLDELRAAADASWCST